MKRFTDLNASLLSPLVAFIAAWVFGALLSQYRLLHGLDPWSLVMVGVVVTVPIAFLAGGLVGEGVALRRTDAVRARVRIPAMSRTLKRILIVFVAIGLLELAHQFARIGGIPLLSAEGNALRFEQGGPTIILTNLLTVAAIVALVKPRELFARESRFELLIGAGALGGFALQAGRGSVVLPVIVATAARWLYWGRPKAPVLIGAGLIAFAAVVFGFYLRVRQNPFNPFEAELFGEILPGTPFFLQPLVPIYLAITTNFVALQGLVGYFPTGDEFGGGAFNAIGLDPILSSARNVSDVSASITAPWVTSTVAGPLWADGGFALLVSGVAITGFLSAGAFAMARRTLSFRWSMVAGYLLYLALFGLYTNLWTQQIDWLMVVPLLLVVGAFAEDPEKPPGLTGRAWARIKRMKGQAATLPATSSPEVNRGGGRERRLAGRLILAGAGVIVLLFVSGLVIQPLLSKPFPLLDEYRLPPSVATSSAVFTNGNRPSDNEELRWIVPGDDESVVMRSFKPGGPLSEASDPVRIPVEGGLSNTDFDISFWRGWRAPAVYVFHQRKTQLKISVRPTWEHDGPPRRFSAPVSAPLSGGIKEFSMGLWGGNKPDLFVISRGLRDARALIQVFSGESNFRRSVYGARLPFRGLGPEKWSVDIAPIAEIDRKSDIRTVRGSRPDLVLVRHDPDKEHSDVQVLLGESGFVGIASQRALDNSGSIPPGTVFTIGSRLGATAVYEVQREGENAPRLRVFGLSNPASLR
jgi:hypothetical protein